MSKKQRTKLDVLKRRYAVNNEKMAQLKIQNQKLWHDIKVIDKGVEMKKNNYILAMVLCIGTTVLGCMSPHLNAEQLKFMVISDINVAIYLFVAWFFDWRDIQ